MDVKLVILLCVGSVAYASEFYNYDHVAYNPYYSFGGYPIETQEEYEYFDQNYGQAPVAASYSVPQQNQVPYANYNTRLVSPVYPTATPVASNVQVTSATIQAAQPTVVSTTPVPLTYVNVSPYQHQQQNAVPVVSTTVTPILSKSYQFELDPHTRFAGSFDSASNVAATSSVSDINSQSVVNPTAATPIVYSTTQNPIVTGNVARSGISSNYGTINLPTFVISRSNVVPYPSPSPYSNNIVSSGGYNFAFNQGSNYNSVPSLIKSNFPSIVSYAANLGGYVSTPSSSLQNLYVPSLANQAVNNRNFYSSTLSKSSFPSQLANGIFNPVFNPTTPNPPVQNIFDLSQTHLFNAGNVGGSNTNPLNSFPRSQPFVTTVSPTGTSNVISYSTTTPSPLNGFVPVTSTYAALKKQTIYAAAPASSQQNIPFSHYFEGNPVAYNTNPNTLLQNPAVLPTTYAVNQGLSYTSVPLSSLSPSVSHNGTPSPVIYSTTSAPIVTTIPIPTTSQEYFSQVTTPRPTIITTQKPSSTTVYTTNQSSKVTTAPLTTQSYNYASSAGSQSITTLQPSTIQNTVSRVSFSRVKPAVQNSNYVPSSFVTKPSTTLVTNPSLSSTIQSSTVKYPLNPSNSTIAHSYATQSGFSTQRPAVTYNSINKQDASAAALSGFSKPTTYKPSFTNNYVSSSSIYNKGVQSTYTTPATYSTAFSTTQSSSPIQKPSVSYNNINKQDAFAASLLGFSKPTTYKPSVTNNYFESSTIYDKGIQSTYTTPTTYSTAFSTTQSAPIHKPTVSSNSINKQNSFATALPGISKSTTYKPFVTNNYAGSSSVYNKGIQSTYTTPATYSTAFSTTQSSFPIQKPTVSYNSINKQSAFAAVLPGISKSATYKPFVTNNYAGSSSVYNKGIQSTYSTPATYSTAFSTTQPSSLIQKPTVSYNSINNQSTFAAALPGISKSTTYKPFVTNNYAGSSSVYNKGIQSTYTTPATYSTAFSIAQSSTPIQKPTVSYNSINKQNAFAAALPGISKSTTYKPFVTNNYAGSSSVYNKGIQSTYTTPATYSTAFSTAQSSFPIQKPSLSYNNINKQDAFAASLLGFSKPTTYKPFVTNNYAGSSSVYNKGIQSTYSTPETYSTAFSTAQSSFIAQKPTVSYNSVNKQNTFSAALSGLSKPTTYKPSVTNSYVGSSTIYNKGIQSTYSTPATYPASTYTTQSSFSTQKPTVSYNSFNKQDAVTPSLSELLQPSTYRTPVTNSVGSSTVYNKGSQSIYTTPATYSTTYSLPSSLISSTNRPVTQSYNTEIVKTTSFPSTTVNKSSFSTSSVFGTRPTLPAVSLTKIKKPVIQAFNSGFVTSTTAPYAATKIDGQKSYKTSSDFSAKPIYSSSTSSQTGIVANSYNPSKNSFSRPVFYTNLYPKNTGTYNFNSFANKATNLVYQPNVVSPNKSSNQFVPFVTIPASAGYTTSTLSTVQRKEFVPVASNYQRGLNVIVQTPVSSETGASVIPSNLEYLSTFVSQSSSPPEAVSNFIPNNNYLPPIVPTVSDVGSNGVVTYFSEPVLTSTVAPPTVVNTTPRTLPLSYVSPSEELKVFPNTNQATVKPVVYTTTPVITKVDSSPTLTSVSYSVPVSSEYAQVFSENPLLYSAVPEATTISDI